MDQPQIAIRKLEAVLNFAEELEQEETKREEAKARLDARSKPQETS